MNVRWVVSVNESIRVICFLQMRKVTDCCVSVHYILHNIFPMQKQSTMVILHFFFFFIATVAQCLITLLLIFFSNPEDMSSSNNKKDPFKSALENGYIRQFDYNTFEDCISIDIGGFGQVKRAYSKTQRKYIALKCLHNKDDENDFYRNFTNEVNFFCFIALFNFRIYLIE